MAKTTEKSDKILLAAMHEAATHGWRRLDLAAIAAAAKLSLADLRAAYPSKAHILNGINDYADRAMLAGGAKKTKDESPRDRLFDAVMRRLDALAPFKDGIAVVVRDGGGENPMETLCGAARLMRSMAWTLEAAGIGSGGVAGLLRTKGLAAIYASVVFVWLRDNSEDLGKTMAALDRRLATAERFAAWRLPRRARPAADAERDAPA
ncbi:MAG: hypothetical protein AB7G15_06600 [Alphaproteobacteria bacterium]